MCVYLFICLYILFVVCIDAKFCQHINQADFQIQSILIYDGYKCSLPVASNQSLIFVALELAGRGWEENILSLIVVLYLGYHFIYLSFVSWHPIITRTLHCFELECHTEFLLTVKITGKSLGILNHIVNSVISVQLPAHTWCSRFTKNCNALHTDPLIDNYNNKGNATILRCLRLSITLLQIEQE